MIFFLFSDQESHIISAEVGEKCEAIGVRLLHLEDQLHRAIHSPDEALFHILSIFQKLLCKRKSKTAYHVPVPLQMEGEQMPLLPVVQRILGLS